LENDGEYFANEVDTRTQLASFVKNSAVRYFHGIDYLFRTSTFSWGDVDLARFTMGCFPFREGERVGLSRIKDPVGCDESMLPSVAFLRPNLPWQETWPNMSTKSNPRISITTVLYSPWEVMQIFQL
jgi:hypothetical protein